MVLSLSGYGSVRTQGTGRITSSETNRGAADVMPALPVRVHREEKMQNISGLSDLLLPELKRRFNERTNTPYNHLQFPEDIVLMAVLWRLRYKLGLRDVSELLLQRGFEISYETIRAWEYQFAPLVSKRLRSKRRGKIGRSWYLDETYVKVGGRWCYLYRAIDRDGNLLDSMLSEHRDDSIRRFCQNSGHDP